MRRICCSGGFCRRNSRPKGPTLFLFTSPTGTGTGSCAPARSQRQPRCQALGTLLSSPASPVLVSSSIPAIQLSVRLTLSRRPGRLVCLRCAAPPLAMDLGVPALAGSLCLAPIYGGRRRKSICKNDASPSTSAHLPVERRLFAVQICASGASFLRIVLFRLCCSCGLCVDLSQVLQKFKRFPPDRNRTALCAKVNMAAGHFSAQNAAAGPAAPAQRRK